MVSLVALAVLIPTQHPDAGRPPRWFENTLAGYAFQYDEKHDSVAVYDPRTGFMLLREPECDGGDMTLMLTRDRFEVAGFGYEIPNFKSADRESEPMKMKIKALPSLATEKGVKIGDSPDRVDRVLGKAHKTNRTGEQGRFLNYTYRWLDGKGEDSTEYEQTYTFKRGKLIEVRFSWGMGGDAKDNAVIAPRAKKYQASPTRH